MVRLRTFDNRDIAALYELDQICFPQEIAYSRAEIKYFLNHRRCSCWIAEGQEGIIAGFIIVERTSFLAQPTGHIVTLDVSPATRRQGVGTLLMQHAEEVLKGEGAAVMSLEVAEDNVAAKQFYKRLGFITRNRIAKYYGGRVDAEVMEKMIAPASA